MASQSQLDTAEQATGQKREEKGLSLLKGGSGLIRLDTEDWADIQPVSCLLFLNQVLKYIVLCKSRYSGCPCCRPEMALIAHWVTFILKCQPVLQLVAISTPMICLDLSGRLCIAPLAGIPLKFCEGIWISGTFGGWGNDGWPQLAAGKSCGSFSTGVAAALEKHKIFIQQVPAAATNQE